jgi:streptogramin lyase
MTLLARLAVFAAIALCVQGCGDTPQARAAQAKAVSAQRLQQLHSRIAATSANPAKGIALAEWIMPSALREISGLALTSHGTVFTHDDNIGRVSEIDPRTGILLKSFSLAGLQKGDFEAIAIAGPDLYLLESSGKLFKFRLPSTTPNSIRNANSRV